MCAQPTFLSHATADDAVVAKLRTALHASGIATSAYSLPYVAQWAGGDVKTVRATAERVVASAQRILRAIETQPAVAVRMVAA